MKKIITIATLSALCASTIFTFDGKVLKERSDTGYSYEGKIEYKKKKKKTNNLDKRTITPLYNLKVTNAYLKIDSIICKKKKDEKFNIIDMLKF